MSERTLKQFGPLRQLLAYIEGFVIEVRKQVFHVQLIS